MTIKEIFDLAIKLGIKADFRGEEGVAKFLERKKKRFEKLDAKGKEYFDKEELENPFLDSRILNISNDKEIKKVMVGIDIEPAEILMAKQLGDIDLVIGHHPDGKGLAHLGDVMNLQCDVLNYYGVPINIAEALMKPRISEVSRGVNSANHERTIDSARLMGVNLMNSHTPCDNLAAKFLSDLINEKKPETVGELIEILNEIPEYRKAIEIGVGPRIFVGSNDNRCGKIAMSDITGGTSGSAKLYEKMANAGIGTVVGMHMSEEHKKEADMAHINIVIAGHISSDSLGVNLFIDELEKEGIEVVPCSGFIRVSRVK